MNKIILILLILFAVLLVNVSSVFACFMKSSNIQLNEGVNKCLIYPDYKYRELNITSLDESNIDTVCLNFSLTDSDKKIIFETLDQYKLDYGYNHIKKQTDEEFNEFQKKMEKVNSEICDCSKITFHERKGDWTIYTNTFKKSCSFSTACYQPPFYCPNSLYFTPVLFLLGVGIIIVGIVVGIIFFIKRRKK